MRDLSRSEEVRPYRSDGSGSQRSLAVGAFLTISGIELAEFSGDIIVVSNQVTTHMYCHINIRMCKSVRRQQMLLSADYGLRLGLEP